MICPPIDEIIWCYGIYSPQLKSLKEEFGSLIKMHKGVPSLAYLERKVADERKEHKRRLIVFDDLMGSDVSSYFSMGSHHLDLSVVYVVQNVFHQSKEMRNVFLNAHYKILFHNPSDLVQLTHLSSKMFPRQPHFLQGVMKEVRDRNTHAYLVIDVHPRTSQDLRVWSDVFPSDESRVYLPD